MFTVTCDKCGAGMQLDEARVPPSGMVKKCPSCGHNLTVMPPLSIGQELDLDGFAPVAPPLGGSAPKASPPALPMARGPALAAFDDGGELELESHPDIVGGGPPDIVDLPAPKGPTSSRSMGAPAELDVPDLLAPVGPTSQRGISDLPAPVGPRPTRSAPPASAPDIPDLLAPVGPTSSRNVPDLLAPVGPTSSRNVPDLLAPVGPRPTKGGNLPDLLAPVGPRPTKGANAPDLLAPVGPMPTKNIPDLLAPVGPVATKNIPDLLAPVGPQQTKGIDLPAPKGFFDDIPQPKPGGGRPAPPDLSLDALDLVPVEPARPAPPPSSFGPPRTTGAVPALDLGDLGDLGGPPPTTGVVPSLDLGQPTPPPSTGLSFDSLDLAPGGEGGKSGPKGATMAPSLDLEIPSSAPGGAPPGVISFGKPTGTIPLTATTGVQNTVSARGPAKGGSSMLDLADPVATVKKSAGTMAGDAGPATEAPARRKGRGAEAKPALSQRAKLIAAIVLGVVVLGGGAGFYVYTRMQAAEELALQVKTGLSEARSELTSNATDHWGKAFEAARKVLGLDPKNSDALGLAAQAQLAWAIDSGQNLESHRKTADEILNDAIKGSAAGVEIDKARALQMILDDKAPAAQKALAAVQRKQPRDPDAPLYLGWAALRARDHQAAKDAFTAALKAQGDRLPALYGLGLAQMALGESAAAQASFDKVLNKTKHIGAWVGSASMLPKDRLGTREKRFMEIVSSAETATAHPHDVSRAWTLAGSEALEARRWDDASFRFKKAEDADPDNVDAIAGRGLALLAQGNVVEARKLFEDANRRDPRHLRALVGLTRLALLEGKWEIAKDFMGQALTANADNAEVQMWNGRVMELAPGPAGLDGAIAAYKRAAELDPGNYEPVVALSLLYLKAGKNDEALAALSTIQKEAEGDPYLANTLGLAYLSANNLDQAEAWFRGALTVEPKNVDAHANLGVTLEKKGNLPEALRELETAHKIDAAREDVAIQLALAYERDKRPEAAEKLYTSIADEAGGKTPTIAARAAAGRYYARRGDLARAGKLGSAILAEDPHHAAGLFLRGIGLLADAKINEAQKDFMEAVAVDPQPQYYEALGRTYEAQNQFDDALTSYSNAIDRDKGYQQPLIDRARVRQIRREWPLSIKDLEAARALDDRVGEIYLMLGIAQYELGNKKAALGPFQQAVERDGKNALAYYKLGHTLYELDRPGEASGHLNRAIGLAAPDATWLPDAYMDLGYAAKASGARGEMCRAFAKYLEVAPATAPKSDVKQILLGCP